HWSPQSNNRIRTHRWTCFAFASTVLSVYPTERFCTLKRIQYTLLWISALTGAPMKRIETSKSEELFHQAQQLIPGGVNSPVRAFRAVGRSPLFIREAEGAHITDVDGNRYIDYVGSWGPMILGHAHPAVIEAIREAAGRGTSYGAPTELETELA